MPEGDSLTPASGPPAPATAGNGRPVPRAARGPRGIARRLALALSLLLAIFGGAAALAFAGLHELHEALHAVEGDVARMRAALRLASAVRDQYAHMAHTIIISDDSHRVLYEEAAGRVQVTVADLGQRTGGRLDPALESIRQASAALDDMFRKQLLPAVRASQPGAAEALHPRILDTVHIAQAAADDLSTVSEHSIARFSAHARLVQHSAIRWLIAMLGAALICAVAVAIYLQRSVARPVAALAAGAARIGSGDLDVRLDASSRDELGRLAGQFNAMAAALKEHQARLLIQEKLAGLGRIAAGVAHEINNPLGVMLGYVKLLRRNPGSSASPELEIIEQEAERCREIVEDLLDLTRTAPLPRENIDLRALCEETVSRLQVSLERPEVRVVIEGLGDVHANRKRLQQLVHNLVRNAFEAVGDAGRIQITIAAHLDGVWLTVADDGSGIAETDRALVFEPFFTTKASGRGLGLAVSRSIARAHGGDLDLLASGRGAAFRLTLPARVVERASS
jgi:two-component system, NtrC family, sensor kinase